VGVLEAIGGFFSGAAEAVAGGAKAVWNAAKSVYLFASSVFDKVGGAWDWMVNGVAWLGDNLIGVAARTLHILEHLFGQVIPEAAAWAIRQAVHWASGAIHAAQHFLEGVVHTLGHFILGVVHTLEHWARDAVRAVWHTLSQAWNFIETVGKRVAAIVLHPERLVAWILPALIEPLLRFLISVSAAIVVWFVRLTVSLLPRIARTLEDALAKLI
jgi:phage-related protein